MLKQDIAIVWLKRDLRFTDHEPLFNAQKQQLPILLIYCFEPSVMHYDDEAIHQRQQLFNEDEQLSQGRMATDLGRIILAFYVCS